MKIVGLKRYILLVLPIVLLTGCGKENLHQDLSERDANEILVVLYKNGIEASKLRVEKSNEVSFSVQVPKDKIHKARKILVDNNLPRKKELGFSGICQEKGLIPTPEEEKCRKLLALKGEIINSLERIPGVIDADVVLNIPEISEFSTEDPATKKPTASAVIRVKKDLGSEGLSESRLQRFISNSVENLDPRDVSVIVSYVEPPQKILAKGPQTPNGATQSSLKTSGGKFATIAGLTLSQDSLKRFKVYSVVMLTLLIGVSAALILNVLKITKLRQQLKVSRAQGGGMLMGGSSPLLEDGKKGQSGSLKGGEKEPAAMHPPAT